MKHLEKLKYNGKEILRGLNFDQEINQISEILEKNKKIKTLGYLKNKMIKKKRLTNI